MSSDSTHEFHEEKRDEIAEQINPFFHGGPIVQRPIFKIGIIWAILTVVGVLIGLFVPVHLLDGVSAAEGHDVLLTIIVFTVTAAPVAALVYAIAIYSLLAWRKRQPADGTPPPDGPPLRGHAITSALWLGGSVVLVLFLLIWGMSELASEQSQQTNAIRVNVMGQQWLWTFSYPGTNISSNTLMVPEGRQVIFQVQSKDVTHGFYPVQLGVQIDANPGFTTLISSTPNKLGRFDVRCSQLCGLYHPYMYTHGVVVTNSQFLSWLRSQGASATAVKKYSLSGN